MGHKSIINFYLKNYYKQAFIVSLLFFVFSIAEAFMLGSFYPLIKSSIQDKTELNPGKVLMIIDFVIDSIPIRDKVISSCLVLMIATLISSAIGFASEFMAKYYQFKISKDFMSKTYESILNKRYDYFVRSTQGEITYLGTNASQSVGELFHYLPKTIIEILRLFVILIFLASISIYATLATIFLIFIAGLGYLWISNFKIYPISRKIQALSEQQFSRLVESLLGIKEIHIYSAKKVFSEKYNSTVKFLTSLATENAAYQIIPKHFGTVVFITAICGALIFLKLKAPNLFLSSISIFTVYLISLQKVVTSIMNIGNNWTGLKSLAPRLELLRNCLDDANKNNVEKIDQISVNSVKGNISFKRITFNYENKLNLFSDFDLVIPQKKFTAFVGSSGSGKTTLINLLTGIYLPQKGSILFGDTELKDSNLEDIRREISIVAQDPFLFNASIRENISLSNSQATDAEVYEAARAAFAVEFIEHLPQKFDTIVGDRGITLSGGQKQRIAIARAILRKPKYLLLDEATSALDNLSESKINEFVEGLKGSTTIIVIAHRLSTIINADQIVVLKNGKIDSVGTHDELLESSLEYKKLQHLYKK